MTTLSVFEPSTMASPSSEIPPTVYTKEVNAQAAAFATAFPDLTKRFNETYTACMEGINHCSSSSAAIMDVEEFYDLIAMGPAIIPLVVQKLTELNGFRAVHIYNALEKDVNMKVNPKSFTNSHIMQRHANLLVDMNGHRYNNFLVAVQGWARDREKEDHEVSLSTDPLAQSENFRHIVEMGSSIIPSIMMIYAGEKEGHWYLLLDKITGSSTPEGVVRKVLYEMWVNWFLDEANLEVLPY